MKNNWVKILILVAIASVCVPFCGQASLSAQNVEQVKVVYSVANVYGTPDAKEANVVATYSYGKVLNVINFSVAGVNGLEFVQVEISDVAGVLEGYVLKSQVLDASVSSPQKRLDSNANLKEESFVYVLNGNTYEKTETLLPANTKVKILSGYNTSNEYTQIQYQNQNGDIVTAYVKTQSLKTSGISRTLIGSVLIIVTTVSLVLIIFGLKGKKHKK